MKIVYGLDGAQACAYYRCYLPRSMLVTRGHDVIVSGNINHDCWESRPDIAVIQRQSSQLVIPMIKYLQKTGTKVVYELDDDFWNIPHTNPAHRRYQSIKGRVSQIIRRCDAVTVSTEPLAKIIKLMNKNVYVLPNSLPEEAFSTESRWNKPNPYDFTIFWAGTPTHEEDLKTIYTYFDWLITNKYKICLMGYCPPHLEDQETYVKKVPFVPIDQYMSYAASIGAGAIGIAPLQENKFNESKSDIKILEYTALGIPVIASYVGSYKDWSYTCTETDDWIDRTKRLLKDRSLGNIIVNKNRSYALSKRTLEINILKWEQAYESILDNCN